MTHEKAFNYLKELSKTRPKAFKLYSLYRAVNVSDGQAYYLFEFDVNLPLTCRLPSLTLVLYLILMNWVTKILL